MPLVFQSIVTQFLNANVVDLYRDEKTEFWCKSGGHMGDAGSSAGRGTDGRLWDMENLYVCTYQKIQG